MDTNLFFIINHLAGSFKWLDTLMILISKYGPILYGLILISLWFTTKKTDVNRKAVIYAVLTAILGLGINMVIGLFYFRPRPFIDHKVNLLISHANNSSFPSDHTTGAFSLAAALFISNKKIGSLSLILAILIAFSRLYVGVHYPSDVLAGTFIGIFSSIVINVMKEKIEPLVQLIFKIWNRIIPTKAKIEEIEG